MPRILVLCAHPQLEHSRVARAMSQAAGRRELRDVEVREMVRGSDFGANAVFRFDAANKRFARFGFPREATNIRQILGRAGEVWLPESGTEHLSGIRTA